MYESVRKKDARSLTSLRSSEVHVLQTLALKVASPESCPSIASRCKIIE